MTKSAKVGMPINSVILLKRLWIQLDREFKNKFVKVLLLSIASSAAEMLTIGAAVPFLAVLSSSELAFSYIKKIALLSEFSIDPGGNYKLWFVILFASAAVLAGLIRVWLLQSSTKLAFEAGAEISSKMFANAITRTYEEHCASSTTEIIDLISVKSYNIVIVVQTALSFLSNLIIFTAIVMAVVIIAPSYLLYASSVFIFSYLLMVQFTKHKISANAEKVSQGSLRAVSIVSEGFGAIRDIIIDGNVNYYIELFKRTELRLKSAQARNAILGNAPKFLMESLGLLAFAILGYHMTSTASLSEIAIPMLGSIALAAQRLLPVLQQIYWGWSSIRSLLPSLQQQLQILEITKHSTQKTNKPIKLLHLDSIEFKNVTFSYKGGKSILKGINVSIKSGEKIGIVGETGSGKSTFVDLIMGLLRPTEGAIFINGMELWNKVDIGVWRSSLAHVPQTIYLANANIAANIVFGSANENVDQEKLKDVSLKAKVDWSATGGLKVLDQVVGENGAMLSGGQRQRIGIARALYKSAELIVFDEATSALDQNIENEIMKTIYEIDSKVTLLIIAHRHSTLSGCDRILEIKDGLIYTHSSYSSYMAGRDK